jgi:hypothetical protein
MQKDPTGAVAPAGGFQNGGWYGGYQYYNGSFAPKAGMINSASPQQGAGQMVSPEVNRQTSVQAGLAPTANQDYIDRLNAQAVTNPSAVGGASAGTTGGTTGGATATGMGYTNPATPDLQSMYKNLYATAGIDALQATIDEQAKIKTETNAKINDNPFLSEATRVGRIAKTEQLYNERTKNTLDQIATKKADVEMQLNLATKQFDINSQASKDALDRFNTLLSVGALDGASGEDIANITRSTGISSSAIQSAISANKKKNVKSSLIQSTDDSGNVTATVINTETGEIISKTSLGKIDQTKTTTKTTESETKLKAISEFQKDAQKGYTLSEMFKLYQGILEPNDIYAYYNTYSKYGADKNSDASAGTGYLSQYGVTLFK